MMLRLSNMHNNHKVIGNTSCDFSSALIECKHVHGGRIAPSFFCFGKGRSVYPRYVGTGLQAADLAAVK